MRLIPALLVVAGAISSVQPSGVLAAIAIDTVPIGESGNPDDVTGFGGVGYNYNMGKFEVTIREYDIFLNAVAHSDPYGLYDPSMASDVEVAGISRQGTSGNYSYSVIGWENHPVAYVSWGDAARFANWLSNGQPESGVEDASTTEDGSYQLNGAVTRAALELVTRHAEATWVIPTEDEWYKAAYYDPKAHHYWMYPTGTNTAPISAPPGNTPNTANIYDDVTGFALTGPNNGPDQNYFTNVGAYTASASPFGTFDQAGNALEWNEDLITLSDGAHRTARGGSWLADYSARATDIAVAPMAVGETWVGFRVAYIPEPSTLALAALGGLALLYFGRRRAR